MGESWAKIHTELLDDDKFLGRSDADFKLWVCLILLAKQSNGDGIIHRMGPNALRERFDLQCSAGKVVDALEYFKQQGMLEITNGSIRLLNYEKRQAVMDKAERNAARQRKWYAEHNGPNARHNAEPNGVITTEESREEEKRSPLKPPSRGATRLRRSFREKQPSEPACTGCREAGHYFADCPRKAEFA